MSVVYEVMVDWDATNWLDTPDFSEAIDDISGYVKNFYLDRGKDVEQGNIPAGTVDLILLNSDRRFSPSFGASPLFGKMRPWLPVRVRATVTGGGAITIFTGFISKISVDPHLDVQEAYLYCTDGMDLLARNMIAIDGNNRTSISDGEAVGRLLDGAGWPAGKRNIDVDGGSIVDYPQVSEY